MNGFTKVIAGGTAAALLAPALADTSAAEWSWHGATGPAHWGSLAAEFALCERGLQQSPIDLAGADAVGTLDVKVRYAPGPLVLAPTTKTVQVDFAPGSVMTSAGKTFALLQGHFHTPSEHTIDGQAFPLTLHLVHATAAGELGVLGVMFAPGAPNAELQKIVEAADRGAADGMSLDPAGLLPSELRIYRYMGSLTTPPCAEGVNWHVAADPVAAGSDQIERLRALMGMNARPLMPRNGRLLVGPE